MMMKSVISVLMFTVIISQSNAQNTSQVGFTTKLADTSYNNFLALHPTVSRLVFSYKQKTLTGLNLYRNYSDKVYSFENLDLTFAGDRYILSKKYPTLILPERPILEMQFITPIPDLKSFKGYYNSSVTIKKDSLFRSFYYYTSTSDEKKDASKSIHDAEFKGDIDSLELQISSVFYSFKGKAEADSILLVIGTVNSEGSLVDLSTPYSSSAAAKEITGVIQRNAQQWRPAWRLGRNVRYVVTLYIEFKSGMAKISIR